MVKAFTAVTTDINSNVKPIASPYRFCISFENCFSCTDSSNSKKTCQISDEYSTIDTEVRCDVSDECGKLIDSNDIPRF
ncbi:hypothetical protein HDU92_002725 [Lobulomyces angularis]|nr:hypothetical protein HDU92_002725 [Lobulomyces angularis]